MLPTAGLISTRPHQPNAERLPMAKHRERIYARYPDVAATPLAPPTLAGLAPRRPSINRLISRHFPADRNAAILELGCGYGALLYFAREAGYHNIRGIDGSPSQ